MSSSKFTVRLGMQGQEIAGTFTCPDCGKPHSFLLKNHPKGSIFSCPCGFKLRIPFNSNEAIAQIRKNAEQALKQGLKKIGL